MSLLGLHLSLWIGPTVPVPAPIGVSHALRTVRVTHNDTERSGFQMTFAVGRSGPANLLDYELVANPLLKPFHRVVLTVILGAIPRVLFDGIITHQELTPSEQPGGSTLTVTGQDLSVLLDLEERSVEHPAQDETVIALKLIGSYAHLGLIPLVVPPPVIDPPIPIERTPVQQGTDLQYLREMADRYGYVFYIRPGPAPLANTAYWGPPIRAGIPQPALTVNMGAETNVDSIDAAGDALAPQLVIGSVQDRLTNRKFPVFVPGSLRPPLAALPAWLVNQPNVRRTQFRESGLSTVQAYARAQGRADRASDDAVTVSGRLDALRYGDVLEPRALVGLRGVGYLHDGLYYVKSVTHDITLGGSGDYRQSFTITREGYGSTTPAVMP